MSSVHHSDKWRVWGYPEDPDWDGQTYDIGYATENGGGLVASGLSRDDAVFILEAVREYRRTVVLYACPDKRLPYREERLGNG